MSLKEFYNNVRRAAKFLPQRWISEMPRLTIEPIEEGLRSDRNWLNRKLVAGYSESDFAFLPDAARLEMTRLVSAIGQITSRLLILTPPTDEQREQALPLLRDLMLLMSYDRFGDAEAFRCGHLIEERIASERPPVLAELRFLTKLSSAGEPGVWIWAYLTDDPEADPMEGRKEAPNIDRLLYEGSREVVPERYPFIHFRTLAEQAELMEEMATESN